MTQFWSWVESCGLSASNAVVDEVLRMAATTARKTWYRTESVGARVLNTVERTVRAIEDPCCGDEVIGLARYWQTLERNISTEND